SYNGSKNASFATNSVLGNQAEAPTAQAVAAVSSEAGVVQYEHPNLNPYEERPKSPVCSLLLNIPIKFVVVLKLLDDA
ncbi:hypothetical protein, partial [Rhizobium johnstonii]|uniref:hypothetical protein n=1 Tax=Rhizobium johnstonii TaxID=3019933 RepID=UPI003F9B056B